MEKDNKQSSITWVKDNFNTIVLSLVLIQITIMLFHTKINMVFAFVLFCLPIVLFVLMKDSLDNEKVKKSSFNFCKISFLIFLYSCVMSLTRLMNRNISNKHNSVMIISLMGFGIMTIIYFFLITNKDINKFLDEFYDTTILVLDKNAKIVDKELGDITLCVNKETKNPEILSEKDRFLHMLVLGPTGSGKTSQILLPLIYQDIQNPNCGITVIEPKADLAEKVYFMVKEMNKKHGTNKQVIYFNPIMPDCPYFNPLIGREEEVIENMATTFNSFSADSGQFFKDNNEILLRYSLTVLKRLRGDETNFIEWSRLISNPEYGRKLIQEFEKISAPTEDIMVQNKEIASWFRNEYFIEKSKMYEFTSALRTQISKIISNKYLRKVLNPEHAEESIDFVKHLASTDVVAIATAQGELRDLGTFLGYFIILQFQSATFKRPSPEETRTPHFLFIDEFQKYSNPGFADMLTQGRSYRVASHLATQNRALIGMNSGRQARDFISLVSTNARNVIMFPGANSEDAEYYSKEFGEVEVLESSNSKSRQTFNPLYGLKAMNYPTESTMEKMSLKARFSASDIMYLPFGEITYRIVKKNSVQEPKVGRISYIPNELNNVLDDQIFNFREEWTRIEKLEEEKLNSFDNDDEEVINDIPIFEEVKKQRTKPTQNKNYVDEKSEYRESVIEDDLDIVNMTVSKPQTKQKAKKPLTSQEIDLMDELI